MSRSAKVKEEKKERKRKKEEKQQGKGMDWSVGQLDRWTHAQLTYIHTSDGAVVRPFSSHNLASHRGWRQKTPRCLTARANAHG